MHHPFEHRLLVHCAGQFLWPFSCNVCRFVCACVFVLSDARFRRAVLYLPSPPQTLPAHTAHTQTAPPDPLPPRRPIGTRAEIQRRQQRRRRGPAPTDRGAGATGLAIPATASTRTASYPNRGMISQWGTEETRSSRPTPRRRLWARVALQPRRRGGGHGAHGVAAAGRAGYAHSDCSSVPDTIRIPGLCPLPRLTQSASPVYCTNPGRYGSHSGPSPSKMRVASLDCLGASPV